MPFVLSCNQCLESSHQTMDNNIYRSISKPIRENLTRDEKWSGPDHGLIACWENGRQLKRSKPDLAEKVIRGELPVMGWKGGVSKKLKVKKYGTLYYLAEWQGMRGDDLSINTDLVYELTCTKTGMLVSFKDHMKEYVT